MPGFTAENFDLVAYHDLEGVPCFKLSLQVKDQEAADAGLDRLLGQPFAQVAGLGVAHEHGVDHVVDRAGADRVVGAVAHDETPRLVQERLGPVGGRPEQGPQRLGPALEAHLGASRPGEHLGL